MASAGFQTKGEGLTPMMQQYRRVKHQIPPDALLLFRLGDFYEMFFDDAKTGSQLLSLALTHRNGVPMCGIPHHAADAYIGKLLKHGRKVAVCDQLEDARPGKLVERDVTQILSPGTHFDTRILLAERNNFLAAVCSNSNRQFGLALVDLTTGDFKVTELSSVEQLHNELARVRPAEIIVPTEWLDEAKSLFDAPHSTLHVSLTPHDGWTFERETAFFTLRDHFQTQSLDGFGAADLTVGIGAAGAALHYLQQSLRRNTAHVHRLQVYNLTDFMVLDAVTQRNLELLEPRTLSGPKHTLIGCLDRTLTPMGARLLREWLTHPLKNVERIAERQGVVATFCEQPQALADFREQVPGVRDLERTLARLSVGSGNARDLVVLKESLAMLPKLKKILGAVAAVDNCGEQDGPRLASAATTLLAALTSQITELPEIVDLIGRVVVDAPPLALKEGGLIKPGYNAQLDEWRHASIDGKAWIAALQQREIERTGIASLKVRFNQVFGYYIEVTKANLDKVPSEYIRKQTIAGGERFYTPELKEMEDKILGADEKANALEYEIFQQIRTAAVERSAPIQESASAVAALDVLAGFAELARHQNYCRPTVTDDDPTPGAGQGRVEIVDGRHPVLEQTLIEERFVPNDAVLDNVENQILIITGPNMAGKSTYIRQVALLVLMAQVGSYIPAARATINLVDRIFTRVGAADDLARGQSTFMVEMNETANILNNATARSLIVLDEIGRGTSTFDGLSIAWAVAEHLHNTVGAKTLFATHYHELTELAATLPRVKNYNVAVREWHDQVIFLHKILPGGTDKSYGIQVGRLAGLPKEVVERAKEVLANLEEAEISADGKPKLAQRKAKGEGRKAKGDVNEPPQMYLFGRKPNS
ncbi:MAG TPA: DNA mismatch repair protein MutS [Verrucomicrobiae bacterium]|nr:DNA mismatch repair protein MutS [Verrucomicrobiae bacterium]